MPVASVNGASLHYELEGHGRPVFVLHGGLGFDHVVYRRTMSPLHHRALVVYFDHRRNGRSEATDLTTVTMEQLADDVVGLADVLVVERFSVLGHSYGGFVAQELALRHPDRLDGLILVDTTPGQLGSGETSDVEQGPPPPPELVELLGSVPRDDDEMAATIRKALPYYFHATPLDAVLPLFDGTIFRVDVMARGFEVLGGWSSVDRLGRVRVPTLVLAGRHDVITSFPQSQRIASRVSDAEMVLFERSGHFPWIEEPDQFFATVLAWLDRTPVAR